ncbi:MAG: 4Fe-4S dicluster domain-containing protein [Treponema sp.]|jgi:carbon-monoxide dehydrogenase iron sulfur subunit|nr:4Fe-4S dicluster domain-containing protein [Treponema sp.]
MKRIFIDREKCDGCKNCSIACMQAHREKPGTVYDLDLADPANAARHEIASDGRGGYIPVFCRHCAEPDCVNSCMSGALKKDPATGQVLYDRDRCGRCFMCVMNCPYGNVKPDYLRKQILKCDFCTSAPNAEEGPNCVKSCPKKALHVEEVFWQEVSL